MTTHDRAVLLDAVLDGRINPGKVFNMSFDLDDVQEAYAAMDEPVHLIYAAEANPFGLLLSSFHKLFSSLQDYELFAIMVFATNKSAVAP